MLILVSNCYQEFNCNLKICVALFKLTMINSILIEIPLMSPSRMRAPNTIETEEAVKRKIFIQMDSRLAEFHQFGRRCFLTASCCFMPGFQ